MDLGVFNVDANPRSFTRLSYSTKESFLTVYVFNLVHPKSAKRSLFQKIQVNVAILAIVHFLDQVEIINDPFVCLFLSSQLQLLIFLSFRYVQADLHYG